MNVIYQKKSQNKNLLIQNYLGLFCPKSQQNTYIVMKVLVNACSKSMTPTPSFWESNHLKNRTLKPALLQGENHLL